MAIQMWTPFRADQNIMAGAESFGRSVGGGLASVGEAFGKAMEEKKRQGQLATSLRKTLKVAYPDRASEFDTMGLPDLQGTLEGEAVKSANARRAQEEEAMQFNRQMQQRKMQEEDAMRNLWRDFGTRGQAPENVPGPVSNEEFARQTSPITPEAFMQAVGRSGVAMKPDDMAAFTVALERMQPKELPNFQLPPDFRVKSVSVDATGRPTAQYGPEEARKVPSGEYPWQYSDDMNTWKEGIRTVKDPTERALLIKDRNEFEAAQGRPSLMERLLMGDGKKPAGGETEQKGTKPTKLRYNIKTGMAEPIP